MLDTIFTAAKPIIGMVHVDDLYSAEGMDCVTEKALTDANNLHLDGHGVDGLLVENWEEHSDNPFVTNETIERMLRVVKTIRDETRTRVGVNILHNDYRAAFKIAGELGLPFTQVDVFVDRVRTEFEHTQGVQFDLDVDVEDVKTHRQGVNAALFVNIHPKHYTLLDKGKKIEESARQAIDNNADGVVVTRLTGAAPDLELVRKVKNYTETHRPDFPVIVGSGMNEDNMRQLLEYGDGAIVGTTFKIDGVTNNSVDPERVKRLMEAVYKAFRV